MLRTPNMNSHRNQLLLTAATASITTFALLSLYNSVSKLSKRKSLDEHARRSIAENDVHRHLTPSLKNNEDTSEPLYDDSLFREQLARNYAFFGEDAMAKVRSGYVAVIGCGGVGSTTAVMLARSGITRLRLVDFDYVTLSSLNRHATATLQDVGTPKVKCVEKYIKQFSKSIQIESCLEVWRKDGGERLLADVDWVVDAIDNIQTKVDLLKYCTANHIKVFSSMGAGAKCDPTRIQISDISSTIYDPLARAVRRRLRLEGVNSGIPVVYSTEVTSDVRLLPLPEEEFQKGAVQELGVFDDFRVRILPVLGPLPAIFGLYIATYIICEIAGRPIFNPLPIKNRRKLYERLLRDFSQREAKLAQEISHKLPIDEDDAGFIFEDLHRGRSVLPPHDIPNKAALVRWDLSQPAGLTNVVVMDERDVAKHVDAWKEGQVDPEAVWGSSVGDIIRKRANEIETYVAALSP